VWHALEDAGYDPADIDGSVGVYGTSTTSGYLLHNLMSHRDPNVIIGQGVTFEMVNLSLQNDKDYLATRVAHQFNLRGPALSVSDGMLVVSGRSTFGLPEHSERRM